MAIQKINRYEVIRELGRGGMATVFLAYDPRIKRSVAVKLLPSEFLHDPGFKARFEREAQTIAGLEHPSIVAVYDFGEDVDKPYLVMRFMPGGSLADRIKSGPIPLDETTTVLERIGSALDYAHSREIIHRDLKPANILFDQFGTPYLADFGIARPAQTTAVLTATGAIIGTPEYMSPEQVQGDEKLDSRSDIYALGIIMYEMLTGRQPYKSDTPAKVMMKHVLDPVPRIQTVKPDLPSGTESIVARAMAKDRDNRYQSAAEMVTDLKNLKSAPVATGAAAAAAVGAQATILDKPPPEAARQARSAPGTVLDEPPPALSSSSAPPLSLAAQPPTQPGWRRLLSQWWFLVIGIVLILLIICVTGVAIVVGPRIIGSPPAVADALPTPTAASTPTSQPVASPTEANVEQEATEPADIPTSVPPVGSDNIYIEYILDASGSMLETLQGETKLAIGREVLSKRLAALPPDVYVGLRVYGHRLPFEEDESCNDIELIEPVDVGNAESIIEWLPLMQARGMTPMSESIRQAAEDFTYEPGRQNTIILISDGIETCDDEPAEVVTFLQELGIEFTIHVIGLDVDEQARAQLQRLAQVAEGVYHDADSAGDLDAALGDVNETIVAEALLLAQAPLSTETATLVAKTPSPTVTPLPTLTPSPTVAPVVTAAPPPTGSPTPEEQPSPTGPPSPTAVSGAVNITHEGSTVVSSTFSGFPASLSLDGSLGTSWFSAGSLADGNFSAYRWVGTHDDLITSISIRSNASHSEPSFRTDFGFESVTVQVLDSFGGVVFEQTVGLPGTPDPDVFVQPNVVGRSVLLILNGHESPDCGGFSELVISADR